MIISINSKRTPPPPPPPSGNGGTSNHRLTQAGALLAVFAASLLLIACPSPGGGGTTTSDAGKPTSKLWHVSTLAGGGPTVTTDGIGTAAGFNLPYGLALAGNTLYVADFNAHTLRTIHTTTAQTGTLVPFKSSSGGFRDGAAASARFNFPRHVVTAGSTLYVADNLNHRIRAIDLASANKAVTTLAGSGTAGFADNTKGTNAQFNLPRGLALNGTKLYVSDASNHRIRAIDLASANKAVSTIAGSGRPGFADHATGTNAQFNNPSGLAVSKDGSTLYVTDLSNHRIRAINLASAARTVSTIAGDGTASHKDGAGTAAQFNNPTGLAVSGNTLYVIDSNNHRIRVIDLTTKVVRTIAGDGTRADTNGIGTKARLNRPFGIVASGDTLYVTSGSLIRKLEYREVGS